MNNGENEVNDLSGRPVVDKRGTVYSTDTDDLGADGHCRVHQLAVVVVEVVAKLNAIGVGKLDAFVAALVLV